MGKQKEPKKVVAIRLNGLEIWAEFVDGKRGMVALATTPQNRKSIVWALCRSYYVLVKEWDAE